jgi:hypothetical protein
LLSVMRVIRAGRDRNVLAFKVTIFTQALLELSDFLRVSIGRARMEKTNNWDLLGACAVPP